MHAANSKMVVGKMHVGKNILILFQFTGFAAGPSNLKQALGLALDQIKPSQTFIYNHDCLAKAFPQ